MLIFPELHLLENQINLFFRGNAKTKTFEKSSFNPSDNEPI